MTRGGDISPLSAWLPNECNANRYNRSEGHFLGAHFDDRQLSGELLANLSLGCDCEMEYTQPERGGDPGGARVRVLLRRCSLQVSGGSGARRWRPEEMFSLKARRPSANHPHHPGCDGRGKVPLDARYSSRRFRFRHWRWRRQQRAALAHAAVPRVAQSTRSGQHGASRGRLLLVPLLGGRFRKPGQAK